jgi:hypothetical protein
MAYRTILKLYQKRKIPKNAQFLISSNKILKYKFFSKNILYVMDSYKLSRLPVQCTYEISDLSQIHGAVENIIKVYVQNMDAKDFSYRILLPRNPDSTYSSIAKKIGLATQAELLLSFKKIHVKPRIREIRYLHDEKHYGWLFLSENLADEI